MLTLAACASPSSDGVPYAQIIQSQEFRRAPAGAVVNPVAVKDLRAPLRSEVQRIPSSVVEFEGFRSPRTPCALQAGMSPSSPIFSTVPTGKRLWVKKIGEWYQVQRKAGPAYLSAACF